jgi:4-diphosphocytidyl-2-C-methyl-D-erythritol kinase
MRSAEAFAKINLGLVVGPPRADGKHEVATVLQRIDLRDTIELEPAPPARGIVVEGFEDRIVRDALGVFAEATRAAHGWRVRIQKRIPVAAGLGGGSSDAAAALSLANELTGHPLTEERLHTVARQIGADVPFFLRGGTQLATGDGSELAVLSLPLDVPVVLVVPDDERKESTAAVYRRFDERGGLDGFDARRAELLAAIEVAKSAADLAAFPGNDLASSPLADDLVDLGAVAASVSGAGPAVYGLFEDAGKARRAARELGSTGPTWVTRTVQGA